MIKKYSGNEVHSRGLILAAQKEIELLYKKYAENATLLGDGILPLDLRTYVCYYNRNYDERGCDYEEYAAIGRGC